MEQQDPPWREIRCIHCHKLLCKVRGIAEIEISCPRCSSLVLWPDLSISILVKIDNPVVLREDAAKGDP